MKIHEKVCIIDSFVVSILLSDKILFIIIILDEKYILVFYINWVELNPSSSI